MTETKNILMIDDSEGDQLLAEMTIENAGLDIAITFASDGEEGLEVLAKMPQLPDLILLDINMPRMNGHEFLHAHCKHNDVIPPVIAMLTSSEDARDKEKVGQYDCVKDYLVKPITAEKLEHLLRYVEPPKE